MECVQVSDLEEGEILENENDSISNLSEPFSDEFGSLKNNFELASKCEIKKSGNKENKAEILFSSENNGCKNFASKCKLSDTLGATSDIKLLDLGLEEVSSDGDCLSEDNWKHSCNNFDYKVHKKKRSQFCETADDIMSEIGETISRKKSHSSHRKKKGKHSFKKHKDNYNFLNHKTSHLKLKNSRRISPDFISDRIYTKEKKRKKQTSYAIEKSVKKPKIRDFDEMRRTLLEKLKMKKEESAKTKIGKVEEGIENSEIQEVEMGIDSTNYVDSLAESNLNQDNAANETNINENDNEDFDLIELRLAALKSNSKQKKSAMSQRKENKEQRENVSERCEDMNLDRYELLLRAEALKTALLKKHQKRLIKAKEKSNETNISSSNNFLNTVLPLRGESSKDEKLSTSSTLSTGVAEQNPQKEVQCEVDSNTGSSSSGFNTKKAKHKRKKRKSDSIQISAKENTESTDVFEEDDRTLRSQLLKDLLKKKSLEISKIKPVLTDSVQTSANELPVVNTEKKEGKEKFTAESCKKNSLEKKNVISNTKPLGVTRIPKPEIKRIIVHLGSEDSSDENDVEVNSTSSGTENKQENVTTKESNERLRANYEKSVDMLLSQTWQKIEGEIAAAKNAHNTPEAVYKHLPLSQRLEYIRLKQKIAEREKLKMKKENSVKLSSESSNQNLTSRGETVVQNSKSLNNTTTAISKSENYKSEKSLKDSGVMSKNVPLTFKTSLNKNQVSASQKTIAFSKGIVVKNGKKYLAPPNELNANQTNQRKSLLQSSQALISKLKIRLKKVKIEKTIEENYEKEICKLKNQITLFEKKKLEQRFKIKKLAEESLRTYKLIQQITNLDKKPRKGAVEKKSGDDGKSKNEVEASEKSKNEDFVKVAEESKDNISKGKAEDMGASENVSLAGHLDYNSPLQAFNKISNNLDRIDPNVMVCQFDLMGVCKDKGCIYQHLRTPQNLELYSVNGKPVQEE